MLPGLLQSLWAPTVLGTAQPRSEIVIEEGRHKGQQGGNASVHLRDGAARHGEIQSLSHCTEPVASPGNSHIPFLQVLPGILLVLFNSHTNFIEPIASTPSRIWKAWPNSCSLHSVSISSTHKIWSWAVSPNTGPRTLQSCLNPVIFGITSSSELCTGANLSPDLLCKPCRSQKG